MAEKSKSELSERKKRILKAIVDAHIVDGEPVGSKYLMQDEHLKVSSATIRNEMAELEALGYLEQPHTSSGRVPSELGYRFYVDSLIESYAMTTSEITEINKLLKSKMNELDQILMAASKVAGSLTNYTSFVIKPISNTTLSPGYSSRSRYTYKMFSSSPSTSQFFEPCTLEIVISP